MDANYLLTKVEAQIAELNNNMKDSYELAKKNQFYYKAIFGFTVFLGVITPIIVIFRKQPFIPQQFWVWWCIITPVLSSICTYLMSYFDFGGKAGGYEKEALLTNNLISRAQIKLHATPGEKLSEVFEFILEEKNKIDTMK